MEDQRLPSLEELFPQLRRQDRGITNPLPRVVEAHPSPFGAPFSPTGQFLAPLSPPAARSCSQESSFPASTVQTLGSEENWPCSSSEEQSSAPSPNSRRSSLGLGTLDGHAENAFGKKGDKKKINERVRRNDNTRLVQEMQELLVAEAWDSDPLSNPNQRSGLKFNKLKIMKEFIGRYRFWKKRCEAMEREMLLLREQLSA